MKGGVNPFLMENKSFLKIYGVLGYPAKHSLSPLMHNAAFKALGINASYTIFEKSPEELVNFLRTLSQQHIFGLNVTFPYKEKVIPFLDKISTEAEVIGAVNTIRVIDNILEGFNTDGEGFLNHLRQDLRFEPKDKNIALIGAGGAAKAVAVYLSRAKPKFMSIYDVDKEKLKSLILHLSEHFSATGFIMAPSVEKLNIKCCDLLINATPVGMKQNDSSVVDEKYIHKNLLVYDLIYNPKETKLLKTAKEKEAAASNGLGMLLYQGMLSFQIWTGSLAPKEVMQKALFEAI